MTHEEYTINVEGSLKGAKLVTYIKDPSEKFRSNVHPLILICPGGGYGYTSDREAEPMAFAFLAMGYHAAVLRYSCAPAEYPTQLLELAQSVALVKDYADEWGVSQIVVIGFSAGAHVAASLGTSWNDIMLADKLKRDNQDFKVDGMMLCYPVITSGEFAHRGSFNNLLGSRANDPEWLDKVSIEKHITSDMPECFVWHTYTDKSVPCENSLMLVSALRRAGVPCEYHLYPVGEHGLGLANITTAMADEKSIQPECQGWIELARTWLEKRFPQ